jgi:hypothetical protein
MAVQHIKHIKKRIAYHDKGELLALLPSHERLEWVPCSEATPPTALKIGIDNSRNILAFTRCMPDKTHRIQYCSKPASNTVHTPEIRSLLQNEVIGLPLDAPFKYNAEKTKSGNRRFSAIVEWYMMGQSETGLKCNYVDFCPRFYDALKRIDEGQRIEEESGDLHHSPIEARTEIEIHSIDCTTMDEATSTGVVEVEIDDLDKLRHYLESKGALHLLENIPEADIVQFVDQKFLDDAQQKKLFIGRHAETQEHIYAYMQRSGKFHGIKFYVEDAQGHVKNITSKDVAGQNVIHPFNKTYPENCRGINQDERARLTLMVKWYFIAARIAKDCVLRETKAYPERLRSALEYIDQRMGSAAVESATVVDGDRNEDSTISEDARPSTTGSRNPSTPAEVTFIFEPAPPCPPTAQEAQQNNSHNTDKISIPCRTKRSAEDAGFEELAEIVAEARIKRRDLDEQIDNIEEQIELLQMQRETLLKTKKELGKEVRRQTIAIAEMVEG